MLAWTARASPCSRTRPRPKDELHGILGYAEGAKARSAVYRAAGDATPMSPLEAFLACRELAPAAVAAWMHRLEIVRDHVLDWVPRAESAVLSSLASSFAAGLIRHNLSRVLKCRK